MRFLANGMIVLFFTIIIVGIVAACFGPPQVWTLTCDGKAIFADVHSISYEDGQWIVPWEDETEYHTPTPGSKCSLSSRVLPRD